MTYRRLRVAPAASVDEARRGPVKGRFCRVCGAVYSLYSDYHKGKPEDLKEAKALYEEAIRSAKKVLADKTSTSAEKAMAK